GPSTASASNSSRESIGNDRTLVGLSRCRHSRFSAWISVSEVNSRLAERRGLASSGMTSAVAAETRSASCSQLPAGQGSSTSISSSTSGAPFESGGRAQQALRDEVAELIVDVDRQPPVADDLRPDPLAEALRNTREHAIDGEQSEPEADQVAEPERAHETLGELEKLPAAAEDLADRHRVAVLEPERVAPGERAVAEFPEARLALIMRGEDVLLACEHRNGIGVLGEGESMERAQRFGGHQHVVA